DHLDNTDHFSGDIRQITPLQNQTTLPFSAGANGTYTQGLQLEGSYNINSFVNTEQLNVIFSAVEEENDARVIQHPEVTCFNGQRAHCTFMNQYAYIADYDIVAGNLDPKILVLNFGDILDVRPVVSSDRKYVTIEIRPSSVLLQGVFVDLIRAPTLLGGGNLG